MIIRDNQTLSGRFVRVARCPRRPPGLNCGDCGKTFEPAVCRAEWSEKLAGNRARLHSSADPPEFAFRVVCLTLGFLSAVVSACVRSHFKRQRARWKRDFIPSGT